MLRRLGCLLLLLLLVAAAGLAAVEEALRPSLEAAMRQLITAAATEAMDRAILGEIEPVAYTDLYTIRTGNDGRVTFLQPNTAAINRLAARVTEAVAVELRRLQQQHLRLPIGQVLQSRLLAARGPALAVTVQSVGSVRATVESKFEQGGINQTRHVVSLAVTAELEAVAPLLRERVNVAKSVPLAEGIVVGPVPPQGLFDLRPR